MIQALGTRAVIKKLEVEQRTQGGIFLAANNDANPRAEVISLGEGTKEKYSQLSVGDQVIVEWSQAQQIKDHTPNLYICDVTSIYAKELP